MAEFRYYRTDTPEYFRLDSDAVSGKQVRRQVDGVWVPVPEVEAIKILKRVSTREVPVDAVPCPFCLVAEGLVTRSVVHEWDDALVIVPRPAPVTAGHRMVIPRRHVRDALEDPDLTGLVFARAAEFAAAFRVANGRSLNLLTSVGKPATQTEPHLHVHLVPRQYGDGLPLLWDRGGRRG